MVIGRVVSVTRATEPVRTEYFEIWNETAVIAPIETVQGTAQTEYAVTAVGDYAELKPGPMFCGDRMTLEPGQIVFGYEGRNGSLEVLKSYALPADLRARLEAYH